MGMIGCYAAVDDELSERILSGEVNLYELSFDDRHSLDIGKTWHAIQYTMCGGNMRGEDSPKGNVVPMSDVTFIPDSIEMGYDFGLFHLSSENAASSAEYLETLDRETFLSMYDFNAMAADDVYPIVEHDTSEDFFGYIWEELAGIKEFYKNAAAEGLSVMFYVC